jgi:hypothetical protein
MRIKPSSSLRGISHTFISFPFFELPPNKIFFDIKKNQTLVVVPV